MWLTTCASQNEDFLFSFSASCNVARNSLLLGRDKQATGIRFPPKKRLVHYVNFKVKFKKFNLPSKDIDQVAPTWWQNSPKMNTVGPIDLHCKFFFL